MKVELSAYAGMRVCVAVSGGKDSIALLHYMVHNGPGYGIKVSAINCDHGIRGEASRQDSEFVRSFCQAAHVPLLFFAHDGTFASEEEARLWRRDCYLEAAREHTLEDGTRWVPADAIATGHHMSDNAETVIFNIARGSGLSGACGITDGEITGPDRTSIKLIRPLIEATRREIDEYIRQFGLPYVTDNTNLMDYYTRNKIRLYVIPELERAVPNAQRSLFRFSRIVKETEDYFENIIRRDGLVSKVYGGLLIKPVEEEAIFSRCCLKVFSYYKIKDYTSLHIKSLFKLMHGANGKRFRFLRLVAFKEERGIAVCEAGRISPYGEAPLAEVTDGVFVGEPFSLNPVPQDAVQTICAGDMSLGASFCPGKKTLFLDADKIPAGAVVRFKKDGDVFERFGGNTKKLGDYFTDIKLPQRLRERVPMLCSGSKVLAVGGIEIAESLKITPDSRNVLAISCVDYLQS
ncbi:MAG: tRNA lysidine(34) synthetase TilS [Clostridia bacterium]|nr:tRNA lysidine(34) synthetase TilS [Clostridia bacterium]